MIDSAGFHVPARSSVDRDRRARSRMPVDEREAARRCRRRARRRPRAPPPPARRGISTWKSLRHDRARLLVLEPREELRAAMRKLDGTMPLAAPECTPSVSTSTVSSAVDDARGATSCPRAGRSCRSPSRDRSRDPARRCGRRALHVGGQVGAAALLARLDQDEAARVRRARALHRLDRGEGAEHRVAVVLGPAAVEPISAADGVQGPSPSSQPTISGCLSQWP